MGSKRKNKRLPVIVEKIAEPLARVRENIQPPETIHVQRIEVPEPDPHDDAQTAVPWSLRVVAAWSWRLVAIAAALFVVSKAAAKLTLLIIPLLLALLFAVLLDPVNRFLQRRLRFPATLSATVSLLVGLGLVIGLLSAASSQILAQFDDLVKKAQAGLDTLLQWLVDGPLHVDGSRLDEYVQEVTKEVTSFVQDNSSQIASGAFQVTSSVANVLTGFLLAMFVLFFLLKEGRRMWLWFVRLMPEKARIPVHESAIRGWITLGAYARTQILVAAIDAVGIGLGAYFLGVPLAIPLGVLVFVGSFIPIVGAVVTGSIAVLVALVDQGPQTAVIMMVIILAVQQIEGNLLQPWLMSNAVSLHPVAVLMAVAAGSYLFGIVGALFAVPVTAFANTSMLYLHGYDKFPQLADDDERPGGPPGTLQEAIYATYDPAMKRTDPEVESRVATAEAVEKTIDVVAHDPQAVKDSLAQNGGQVPSAGMGENDSALSSDSAPDHAGN
ncbi:MAG: AI-2E family transporter [Actinomycetaceae bacterium]|nr:AI-2E family transporter [Actinomycetaceae bacterium]